MERLTAEQIEKICDTISDRMVIVTSNSGETAERETRTTARQKKIIGNAVYSAIITIINESACKRADLMDEPIHLVLLTSARICALGINETLKRKDQQCDGYSTLYSPLLNALWDWDLGIR